MTPWLLLLGTLIAVLVGGLLLARHARRDPAVVAFVADVRALRPRELWRFGMRLTRGPRVPMRARLTPPVVVLYLLLPFDVIPDFIPLLGQLDDLLVIVLAAWVMVRLIPADVLAEHRAKIVAERSARGRSDTD